MSNDKSSELEKIAKEIAKCKECKKDKFGLPVPGEGNPNAKIIFVGMSPGREESKTGRPFVGRSGKFLTKLMFLINVKREETFLTSPVKFYQGKRNLTDAEISHGRKHLLKQIDVIKPKFIVLLGNVAIKALFPDKKLFASKVHGKFLKKNGIIYFFTFHPAAAMRFPKIRKLMKDDFLKLKRLIK